MSDVNRSEHDSMGDVVVPAGVKWQAQTQRAVENFPVSGQPVPHAVIVWLAQIKAAAAGVNAELGVAGIDSAMATAIESAAAEVIAGQWIDQFPIDVFQTGSGTSTNMNMNEVLATLASERLAADGHGRTVHPNDHVNASQSSNDVFPSAIRLAVAEQLTIELVPALTHLAAVLRERSEGERDTVKAGRTHLMDAMPVTLGQELGGHARMVELGIERVQATFPRLRELPLGGTAVGTGTNCPVGFASAVIERLSGALGMSLVEALDHFEAQGAQDVLVEVSGACRVVAVSLNKIANDLRWMGSGPHTGLAEIHLPALQPGSSIMPGKVNPVIPEVVCQVVAQVIGNDAAVAWAGAAGSFELNTMLPVLAKNVIETTTLLSAASMMLADRCIAGITADRARMLDLARRSPAIVTALNPIVGYERAAGFVKEAEARGISVAEVIVEQDVLPADELERVLDVLALTRRPS
ncbi:MAG: class II fumarate hydratase [Acidimicrobiia bacterium]